MPVSIQQISDLDEVSSGVFYPKSSCAKFFTANWELLRFLKEKAANTPLRRARVCVHPDPQADQHDMLIASHRDTYVAPHNHPRKSESFLVMEGFADIFLFNNDGSVSEVIPMGPPDSGRSFMYRMPAGQFHSLMIYSEVLLFMESTRGPFDLAQTTYADWAPAPDQIEAGRAYLAALSQK